MNTTIYEDVAAQHRSELRRELDLINSRIAHNVWTWRDRERKAAIERE